MVREQNGSRRPLGFTQVSTGASAARPSLPACSCKREPDPLAPRPLPACLGRQPNHGPAILCPARVDRFLASRSLVAIWDDDEAVSIDTADHQILTDRV